MLQVDQNGLAHKMEVVEGIGQLFLANFFCATEVLCEFFVSEQVRWKARFW